MALAIRLMKNGSMRLQNCKPLLLCQSLDFYSTLNTWHLTKKWRRDKRLPQNPNACGPLTDRPDYSYLDGKTVPVGSRMSKRLKKQKEYAEKIVTLCKEVDFAVEWDKQLKLEEENAKRKILEDKLKPKGHLLLKK